METREGEKEAKCVQALAPLLTGPRQFSILAGIQAILWDWSLLTIGNTERKEAEQERQPVRCCPLAPLLPANNRCIGLKRRLRNVMT